MLRRVGGVIVLMLGTTILLWVGDNFLVERRLPETRGLNPLPALLFVGACFYVGLRWIRGEVAR